MKNKILLLILAVAFVFSGCGKDKNKTTVNRQEDYSLPAYSKNEIDLFLNAHTTNKFSDDVVTLAQIENVLKAAVNSPDLSGEQNCHFTTVISEEYMKQIVPEATKGCAVIIVSAKTENIIDSAFGAQSIFLSAQAMGFGAKISTNNIDVINSSNLKQFFGIPEGYNAVCAICIGHPDKSDLSNTPDKTDINDYINYIE